jgi:hypothetical protein
LEASRLPCYTFVERSDMLSPGSNNVPMATGNESEALVALVNGRMQTFEGPKSQGPMHKSQRLCCDL